MTGPAAEVSVLHEGLRIWHRYDATVKADLYSTALTAAAGVFLIDCIALPSSMLQAIIAGDTVAGVFATNENHIRATPEFAKHFRVPVYRSDAPPPSADLCVLDIEGAAPSEAALYCTRGRGTIVVGDAVINFGAHGFTFLPAKYCSDAKLMRRSLRKLLDLEFECMLFAHGEPILTGARDRLATLLNAS